MKIQEAGKFWLEYHKVNSRKKHKPYCNIFFPNNWFYLPRYGFSLSPDRRLFLCPPPRSENL